MKVMIVDDSSEVRLFLRELLAPVTRDVVECTDGDEVLAAYAAHRPAWTLMDVRMPRLDGLSATRALRAQWPDCRVLIVTFHASEPVHLAALAAGAKGCVPKDRPNEILAILEPGKPPIDFAL